MNDIQGEGWFLSIKVPGYPDILTYTITTQTEYMQNK